jgi:predicted metalloprotease with PDZ domain
VDPGKLSRSRVRKTFAGFRREEFVRFDARLAKDEQEYLANTTSGAKEIVVNYRVYANELTVRTNELNDDHAFWNNAALLMFPKDQLKAAST